MLEQETPAHSPPVRAEPETHTLKFIKTYEHRSPPSVKTAASPKNQGTKNRKTMHIENKERKRALRIGCIVLVASAAIILLALYGAVQIVYNHIIPLL